MQLFHAQTQASAPSPRCPGCAANLGQRMVSAVFCPQCGKRLREPESVGSRLARAGVDALHHLGIGRSSHEQQTTADSGQRSPMLLGYGNALYTLGWRYERGHGPFANRPEAVRCYKKSARLGNLDATMRLAVIAEPPAATDPVPPPLPVAVIILPAVSPEEERTIEELANQTAGLAEKELPE